MSRGRSTRSATALAGGLLAAHALPSVLTIPALHRTLLPRLSGRSGRAHVALTFDDGPDPASTPQVLEQLRLLELSATFFLLGCQLEAAPELGRQLVAAGHEVAVHGYGHRPHLLRTPWAVHRDLARATELVAAVTGEQPHFWRPPNGIVTGAGLAAARRLGLRPVLWTADGRDWDARATAGSVLERITAQLGSGGTVLLHDSDLTSAPLSWRSAVGALPGLQEHCTQRGWALGPLRDHWPL